MHEGEKWKWSHSVVSDSLRPHGLQPTRLLRPWDFLGKSTGVGCHCLLRLIRGEGVKLCSWKLAKICNLSQNFFFISSLQNNYNKAKWYKLLLYDLILFSALFLEKEMATHSSVLAWRIPGTGEPGRLPSMGSHRVRHNWSDLAAAAAAAAVPCPKLFEIQFCNHYISCMYSIFKKNQR